MGPTSPTLSAMPLTTSQLIVCSKLPVDRSSSLELTQQYRGTAITVTDQLDIRDIQENICDTQDMHQFLVSSYVAITVMFKSRMTLGLYHAVCRLRHILLFLEISVYLLVGFIEVLLLGPGRQSVLCASHTSQSTFSEEKN
jgi:hypothetical protein